MLIRRLSLKVVDGMKGLAMIHFRKPSGTDGLDNLCIVYLYMVPWSTSIIHSKIDYCNSLLLNLTATQTNRLQLVLNSAARAVTKTPKFHHITPILKSLYWLKINDRIKY